LTIVSRFELVLLLMAVVLGLELLARRVRMPPAAAFILGGIALALVPGTPDIELDPDLALVLFLPPLLLASAYFTVWRDFRANLRIILQLAVGAVAFTTLVVGVVAHWVEPSLPWAACFALGAIVSPPDAVAAKAVLERLSLPPRITVLLEGESLVNDASGLVLYRFAVAAALTGTFDAGQAAVSFAFLAAGGVAAGVAFGWLVTLLLGRLRDPTLSIIASFLVAWVAYIFGEALHVSGVLATVACGLVMGWRHALGSHSNPGVSRLERERIYSGVPDLHPDRVVATWCAPSIGGKLACDRKSAALGGRHHHRGYLDAFPLDLPSDLSAARFDTGVAPPRPISASGGPDRDELGRHVSLAAALALPDGFPGRDFILATTFAVILVTVLVQGATLAPLIRALGLSGFVLQRPETLQEAEARARMAAAQLAEVERQSAGTDEGLRHPRLVEQYSYRARAAARFNEAAGGLIEQKNAHFTVVLAAVTAGRAEILRLHRAGSIHDNVLHALEQELDLEEMSARRHLGAQD
jgi:monovalent cation/hydrogen antiporter